MAARSRSRHIASGQTIATRGRMSIQEWTRSKDWGGNTFYRVLYHDREIMETPSRAKAVAKFHSICKTLAYDILVNEYPKVEIQ